jgi:hypothetical protein
MRIFDPTVKEIERGKCKSIDAEEWKKGRQRKRRTMEERLVMFKS